MCINTCLLLNVFSFAMNAMEGDLSKQRESVQRSLEAARKELTENRLNRLTRTVANLELSEEGLIERVERQEKQLTIFRTYVRAMNPNYVLENGEFNEEFYWAHQAELEVLKKNVEESKKNI